MKVSIDVSAEHKEPFAVIYTDRVTDEIQNAIDFLGTDNQVLTAQHHNKIVILKPNEIYMVRVEGKETVLYGEKEKYFSRKRLYEIANQLGNRLIQISKSVLVNPDYLDSVEAGFNATLILKLKNGSQDYVTRTYLPKFKKYLGL